MRTWGITDTGIVRMENQDFYDVRSIEGYTAAVVCDGMGGTAGGKLASSAAVETFQKEMERVLKKGMSREFAQECADISDELVLAISLVTDFDVSYILKLENPNSFIDTEKLLSIKIYSAASNTS